MLSAHKCVLTGSVPGSEASKKDTDEFGGAWNLTCDPEKSLEAEEIWACISRPITASHSPFGLLYLH